MNDGFSRQIMPFLPRIRETKMKANLAARKIAWGCCALWTILWGTLFWNDISHAKSAPQETAASAMYLFVIVAGYILCRAVESLYSD